MCSSKDPSIADERTTTEIGVVNNETSLPWELTGGCSVTIRDTIGLFIQGHMDFGWVYRHHFVKRLQVFQVKTSLLKKH
jgi:hypothetical protein